MFDRVCHCLLSDAIQLIRSSGIVDWNYLVAGQNALNAGLFTNGLSQILQCDDQAFGLEFWRKEATRKVPGEINPFFKAAHQLLCIAGFRVASCREFFLQYLSRESRASQVLPQFVMQIVAQPPPLTIRHLRDLLIESSPLNRLALVRCSPFVDTSIEFPNEGP